MARKTINSNDDYPVTLEYNAVAYPYYTHLNRHKGRDFGTPTGTPVKIGRKLIGYTGTTGLSSGPHLHVSKWVSTIVNFLGFPRRYYDPADIWKIKGRVVYSGWLGTAGKCVIIKEKRTDGKRVFYMFAHLSVTSKKRGDWV